MTEKGKYPKDGGEMGDLTRDYDWSNTPLGAIESWPISLRIQVQMMLSSRFPMLIFWGPSLITFYNDAFRPSLGIDGKHPSSLGQPGEISWAESWPTIGPMIYNIMAGGEAVWFEDQKLPLYRDGKMGYAYWTYSFSPISDNDGNVGGILVTCSETTKAVEKSIELEQTAKRLDDLFRHVSGGIAQADLGGRFTAINDRFCEMLGYSRDELLHLNIADITHPDDRQQNAELLRRLIDFDEEFLISKRYICKDGSEIWVSNSVSIIEDESGTRTITAVSIDNTEHKLQELRIAESEARFQNLIRDVPVGLVVLMGEDMRVEMVNEAYCRLIGFTVAETLNRPLFDVIPDAKETFLPILQNVFRTGQPFIMEGATYLVHGADGEPISGFVNLVYQPYRESDGRITGVVAVVVDVSEQTLAQQKVQHSEARFRSLIEQAPVATCLFLGREQTIAVANDLMLGVWGKDESVIGKRLDDGVPELRGQPFLDILDQVYTSGKPYAATAARAMLEVNGVLAAYYFNFTYKPLLNESGEVYGIIDMAVDVTEQVEAHQKLEATEQALRGAIELAQLATWTIDLRNGTFIASSRKQEWLGVGEETSLEEIALLIQESDRERIAAAYTAAATPGGHGTFDELYTTVHPVTRQKRIVHATGKTSFDEAGYPVSIAGTSQDVTIQQELRLELEHQVQLQTEELESAVEELRATNEELSISNDQLLHSNDELAQYAYVASHDLQEPLRKIRVFTNMLQSNENTAADNRPLIDKISASASRMSLLIQDLLAFSKLLKSDSLMRPVSLGEVVSAVWDDFELLVAETQASIELTELPVIEAVSLQMNQLFYNLISNALKFISPERKPHIVIRGQRISAEEAGRNMPRPLPFSDYFHITVSDNGIGFEAQYNEQIFEVFKRLHGRDMFPGSGIGLALCRRIAANHHGVLFATSEPDKGSVFHILLPERQHDVQSAFGDEPMIFPELK